MDNELDKKLENIFRRVYGGFFNKILESLYKPSMKLYARVNTMYISREELIKRLRSKGYEVYPDPYVEDAFYFNVKGPFEIDMLSKKIYVDKIGAEAIMIGANLYAPGITDYDNFRKGDKVTVVAPNDKPIAIVKTVISSDKLKGMKKGLVGLNLVSIYKAPPIRDLQEYEQGLFYPQNLPAILTTHILNPKPYELIIDMNSAPGGKISHIIQLTHGLAHVIGFERNVKKALMVVETLKRLRLFKNVIILPMDSRYIHIDLNISNKVDKVLIDPPCSGLGVRPKIYIDKSYEDIIVLSKYQLQFLKTASHIVKCDGIIVYSTCTLTFEENEEVTLKAMEEYGFESIDLGFIPYSERIKYKDLVAYRFSPLYHDMPGYYIVVLTKKC